MFTYMCICLNQPRSILTLDLSKIKRDQSSQIENVSLNFAVQKKFVP